jgi:hypothetical protein
VLEGRQGISIHAAVMLYLVGRWGGDSK